MGPEVGCHFCGKHAALRLCPHQHSHAHAHPHTDLERPVVTSFTAPVVVLWPELANSEVTLRPYLTEPHRTTRGACCSYAKIEAERAQSWDHPTAEDAAELPDDGAEPDLDECMVCYGPLQSATALPCGHTLCCLACLREWEKHVAEAFGTGVTCPYCRGTMPDNLLEHISSEIGLLACRANYLPPESEARCVRPDHTGCPGSVSDPAPIKIHLSVSLVPTLSAQPDDRRAHKPSAPPLIPPCCGGH